MNTWQGETARYNPTVGTWPEAISKGESALARLGVQGPFAKAPSERETLGIELIYFAGGNLRGAAELVKGAGAEWSAGRFVMVCLAVRLMLEFSAATYTAAKVTERLAGSEQAPTAEMVTKVHRLVAGARFPVALPRGGATTTPSINVLTFIEELERGRPGSLDDYAFLCAGSHPCHLQQLYLHMAGGAGDNWSNRVFAAHAHEMLERLVRSGSNGSNAIAEDTARMADLLTPLLTPHRSNR